MQVDNSTTAKHHESRRALSVSDFARAYGIGRTTAFQELRSGRLRSYKLGKKTLIAADDAEGWFRSLPTRLAPRRY